MPADYTHGVLLCRAGSCLCALPLPSVVETLRPLPMEVLAGAPEGVLGVSIVRGRPTPIVDARHLLGQSTSATPGRLVTLRLGPRTAALAFDAVLGVRSLAAMELEDLPPLLGSVGAELASRIGAIDGGLLLVLQAARLVPSAVWTAVEEHA